MATVTGTTRQPTEPPSPPRRFARLLRFLAARVDPKAYLGLHVTVGFAVAALALWLFGAVLEEVLDNAAVVQLDVAATAWVQRHTTVAGLRISEVISWVGSPVAMTVIGVIVALVLWRQQRRLVLVGWLAANVGGLMLDQVLKDAVHRARPVSAAARLYIESFSFPSGHSMGSTISYGMLAYVITNYWRPQGAHPGFVSLAAAAIVLAVGTSRVYLDVHFPTDVFGRFAAGVAWLAFCLTGMRIARGAPAVVPPDAPPPGGG